MNGMLPATVKETAQDFRDRLKTLAERWLPRRRDRWSADGGLHWPSTLLEGFGPAIDVAENDDEIIVTAELPGLEPSDFRVEAVGERLILTGEKKASREERDRDRYYSECGYGYFQRIVPLPCEVDTGGAKARYKNGVLRVTLPKSESAKRRRVRVKIQ